MGKQKVNCAKGVREAGLDHALLSASSSHRWLHCTPSARLEREFNDNSGFAAAEGTAAHTLCEYKLRTALGEDMSQVADIREHLDYYNAEMEACADGYVQFILEQVAAANAVCTDPMVLIEQKLNFSKYVPEGFGTGDCVIIADGTLHIVDYKHGQGVLVDAEENPQMKLYALGALELFDGIYDISTVSMTIYQPRRENVSTFSVFKESLYQWAEEILIPTAAEAFEGNGEYRCGEWCQFCRAKNECRTRAEHNMALARYEFKKPPLLEDDEIEAILAKIDALVSWASDIKAYALDAALQGKQWRDWKLVAGRSNRKISNEVKASEILESNSYTDIYKHELLGITALEKAVGKERLSTLLGGLIIKPEGKPTLVPSSDKRPAINTAADDFADQSNLLGGQTNV
jgi:hypothetical protein